MRRSCGGAAAELRRSTARRCTDRVAHERRGGYCFQLNGALSLVLESLGYRVTLHQGAVHGPEGPMPDAMDNHLALIVHDLPNAAHPDGTWWVDAGLGDVSTNRCRSHQGCTPRGAFHFALRSLGDDPDRVADWQVLHHDRGTFTGIPARGGRASRRRSPLARRP